MQGALTRLRSAPTLIVPQPKSQRFRNSVTYAGPVYWEALPPLIRQISNLDEFRRFTKLKMKVEFAEMDAV